MVLRTHKPEQIEAFSSGLRQVADIVHDLNPDYIFAPVVGAVPFVDLLNIVDRHFPIDRIEYLPNSSRFERRDELMSHWYENFYKRTEGTDNVHIVCLDEVLSGASAVKGQRQFKASLNTLARTMAGQGASLQTYLDHLRHLGDNINYHFIGLAENGHKRTKPFNGLVERGVARVVNFDLIPTIDNIHLNPVRLKIDRVNSQGRALYAPEVDHFEITPQYMTLLQNVAQYVGQDPLTVGPINFAKIQEGLRQATR